jgi:chaperonin GroEL (HSP60 family)
VAQPLLRIARRAGLEPGTLLRRTREDQHDSRFDVVARRWITGATPELVDPFAVVQRAVQAAVSAAVTALSSAVLVRSARPERSLTL